MFCIYIEKIFTALHVYYLHLCKLLGYVLACSIECTPRSDAISAPRNRAFDIISAWPPFL